MHVMFFSERGGIRKYSDVSLSSSADISYASKREFGRISRYGKLLIRLFLKLKPEKKLNVK